MKSVPWGCLSARKDEALKYKINSIIGLIFFCLIALFSYNYLILNERLAENQYHVLMNELNVVMNDFNTWINEKRQTLETTKAVVDNFSYAEITRPVTNNRLLNVNSDAPESTDVYIGLADGGFVTGAEWIPAENYDPRTRVWYQQALEQNDTIISHVYVDKASGDDLITISSPLYRDGSLLGIIALDLFLTDISSFLDSQMTSERMYSYLLDAEGDVLAHTLDSSLVGQNVYQLEDDPMNSFTRSFDRAKQSGKQVRMEYVYEGREIRGIVRRTEFGSLYLSVADISDTRILSPQVMDVKFILFNGFMTVSIFILLGFMLKMKKTLYLKNEILLEDSQRDGLTGVYNRRFLNQYLLRLWKSNSSSSITVFMMDLDYFKDYNDTYGHLKGDEVLKNVARTISKLIRNEDVLARYGGEEFTLIVEDVQQTRAGEIAENILKAIFNANIPHTSNPLGRVTISIGIAATNVTRENEITSEELIDRADKALYMAKAGGRNNAVFFEEAC